MHPPEATTAPRNTLDTGQAWWRELNRYHWFVLLVAALGCGFALASPAFPTNARTVYQGHLFVGGTLLNESGMEHHPLTPMTDANLVRVLSRQTEGTVGLVPFVTVDRGARAIRRSRPCATSRA